MALTCLLDTSVWNRLDHPPALAAEVTALVSGRASSVDSLNPCRVDQVMDGILRIGDDLLPEVPGAASPLRRILHAGLDALPADSCSNEYAPL